MGRKVKIRVNYTQDAIFLTRLQEAIESDDKRSLEWKKEIMGLLNRATVLLLQASANQETMTLSPISSNARESGKRMNKPKKEFGDR